LHGLGADQCQVVELAGAVVVVTGVGGVDGREAVDIDADVVVVGVLELGAPDGVELDAEDAVAGVAVVVGVEEAQVLAGQRVGEAVLADEEDDTVAAEVGVRWDDAEHERRREGAHGTARRPLEPQRRRVHRVALELRRAVGELQQPRRRDGGRAVQRERRAGEARVDEVLIVLAGAEDGDDDAG